MRRLRRESRRFKRRAINSLLLAVELFNRPHDIGRAEAVLMLLQHSFEMLLKGAIYQKRGSIFDKKDGVSYRFDRCLGIARGDLQILDDDQVLTLATLDSLRDCATHNLLDLSEQALYVHAQAAVIVFDRLLTDAFGERLADHLPERVLPVSTNPPHDMLAFMDSEFSQVRSLLAPGKRRTAEARGTLRHLMMMESNIAGDGTVPSDRQVNEVARRVQCGDTWQAIFPGVASLRIDTQGHGLDVAIRFTRSPSAAPVRLVKLGEPDANEAVVAREVNLLDRFSMGLRDLAQNLSLTPHLTLALVHHLKLRDDADCYKEFHIGKSTFKRYSPLALDRLKQGKETVDLDDVRRQFQERPTSLRSSSGRKEAM